ncbi:MAG: exodeoxyribonuclease III [Myxococcota bacterium]
MRIATWNVNSVKARHDRILAWLEKWSPDVLCLQELKCTEDKFPFEVLREHGYQAAAHCQKTYNGVAIVSRMEADEVIRGMDGSHDDPQARLITARLGGVCVVNGYFPNGQRVGSDKYAYKLDWMRRLRAWLDRTFDPADALILAGDFNVAPDDADVAHPEEWKGSVLCHPDARAALADIRTFGFVDVFRKHHPEGGVYSWWDYRQLAFPKGNGLRIDHVYATPPVAERSVDAFVDRDERKGKSPSDHAPVVIDLA